MTGRHLCARPRLRTVAALAAVAALALAIPACGRSKAVALDRAATERAVGEVVAGQIEKQAGFSVEVSATRCPSDIPRGSGRVTMCNVTVKGVAGKVRARVRQVDDHGRLDVTLLDSVLSNPAVANQLQVELKKRFSRSFQANCGKGMRIAAPKAAFTCRARDASSRRTVQVTVVDSAGTLRFSVLT